MINIDHTLFVQIVNFLALIFILNHLLYKPIRKQIAQRKDTFGGLSGKIDKARKEAEEKLKALEAGLAEARGEGKSRMEALLKQAQEEEKRIISEINAKAREDLDKMRAEVTRDVAGAEKALSAQVDEFARAIGEKILGRTIA